MLVTCIEAYLEDVLRLAAAADRKLMAKSTQQATYDEILRATSDPASWAIAHPVASPSTAELVGKRLKRMGAKGYSSDLANRLELMWGLRHVIVHRAGIATADLVRRHPGIVTHFGDRVRVSTTRFAGFLVASREFLEPTDAFFLKRYPRLHELAAVE